MKKKIMVRFGIVFFLLSSLTYAQTDTLKVLGTTGKIGTTDHIVPVHLKNNYALRALQLSINYPIDLLPLNVVPTPRTTDLNIEHNTTAGTITLLIYGWESTISPDTGSIVDISFAISPDALPGYYPLPINNIYASDSFGGNINVNGVDGVFTITNGVIPVELASFNGSFIPLQNKIKLEWRTSTESNNYGFEILRGVEKVHLAKIGFVPGHGTTSSMHEYHFFDSNLTSSNYFYQLQQIDFDGAANLSEIINVTISSPQNYSLSQNYPNPFSLGKTNSQTALHFQIPEAKFVEVKIYDIMGREIKALASQKFTRGIHTIQWDGRTNQGLQVSPGVYYYTMKTKNYKTSRKMIILE